MKVEKQDKRIEHLQQQIDELKENQFHITRFLPAEQKQELRILIEEQIADITWEDYLYISEFFQYSGAYSIGGDTLSPTVALGAAILLTNTTAEDSLFLAKDVLSGGLFSFDEEVRFKINARWGQTNTGAADTAGKDNAISYIVTLADFSGDADTTFAEEFGNCTGFKMEDGVLYGFNMQNGNQSQIKLLEIEDIEFYSLSLKYYPRDRVDFFVDNILLRSLSTNLPNSNSAGLTLCNIYNKTKTSTQTQLTIEYFEYMQNRTK